MKYPEVADAIAVGRVPQNISAEFLKESRDGQAMAGIMVVAVLTSVIVLGRLWSRMFLVRRFGTDDYLTLLSFVSHPFVPPFFKTLGSYS